MLEIDSDAVAGIDLDSGCCHWRGCDDHHRLGGTNSSVSADNSVGARVAATDSNGVAVINWVVERQDFLVLINACVAVGILRCARASSARVGSDGDDRLESGGDDGLSYGSESTSGEKLGLW
jgi:hypothetical protein